LPPQPGTAARVGLQAHHGTKWCEQCEDRVSHAAALTCKSRWYFSGVKFALNW